MNIVSYNTPQEFLQSTLILLERNEVENNLIIGLCNGLIDNNSTFDNCVFVNAITVEGNIQASSIKTLHKAIVTCYDDNLSGIKAIAEYYKEKEPPIKGVVGKTNFALEFSKSYGRQYIEDKVLIVHQLESLNKLPISKGILELASTGDIDLITKWSIQFETDVQAFPKATYDQMHNSVTSRINSGSFFKWICDGEIVSIAAIVRQTTNACIIGLVYTPSHLRGKGFATSCVQRLSEIVLEKGFKFCGLYTDKANPTSNNIYKNIGYVPIEEHSDIEFID